MIANVRSTSINDCDILGDLIISTKFTTGHDAIIAQWKEVYGNNFPEVIASLNRKKAAAEAEAVEAATIATAEDKINALVAFTSKIAAMIPRMLILATTGSTAGGDMTQTIRSLMLTPQRIKLARTKIDLKAAIESGK